MIAAIQAVRVKGAVRCINCAQPREHHTGMARLLNLRPAVEDVNNNQIPGAILEMGVWRGGGIMLAAAICEESGFNRPIYLYDAFDHIHAYSHDVSSFLSSSLEMLEGKCLDLNLSQNVFFSASRKVNLLLDKNISEIKC